MFSFIQCWLSSGVRTVPERHPPPFHLPTASLHPAQPQQGPGPGQTHKDLTLRFCMKIKSPRMCQIRVSALSVKWTRQVTGHTLQSVSHSVFLFILCSVSPWSLIPARCWSTVWPSGWRPLISCSTWEQRRSAGEEDYVLKSQFVVFAHPHPSLELS